MNVISGINNDFFRKMLAVLFMMFIFPMILLTVVILMIGGILDVTREIIVDIYNDISRFKQFNS